MPSDVINVFTTPRVPEFKTVTELSPWFRTKICPPAAAWTILTGLNPTHTAFVTDRVDVEMELTDPVILQVKLTSESSAYMLLVWVAVRKTGRVPVHNPMVVTPLLT